MKQMRSAKMVFAECKKRTRFDPNEIIVEENQAKIYLYDKYGNKKGETIIDLEDIEKCKLHKWHKKEGFRGKEYVFTRINRIPVRLHRFLLNYYEKEYEIDHIDGNGLNNKKENLRIVYHQENCRNQNKLLSNNKSGYTGVHWHTQNYNWTANIKINGKHIHLGSFENIEDAVAARKRGEEKYFTKETLKQHEN